MSARARDSKRQDGTHPFHSLYLLGRAPTRVGLNPHRTTGGVCVCAAPIRQAMSITTQNLEDEKVGDITQVCGHGARF